MKKNVMIKIDSCQELENNEKSKIEFMTEGKYYRENNSYYIVYDETEINGIEGTTTTIKVSEKSISITRFNAVESNMVFEKDRDHISLYKTKYGALSVKLRTEKMELDLDDDGGMIKLEYMLEISNSPAVKNVFNLHIREVGE